MTDLKMFIPLTKIDEAKRLVYGIATGETPDSSDEICDYDSTKPLYEKWSEDFSKASDGKSLGNLRAMHGPTAAGKLTEITFNDAAKQIEICAKVVDDAEWNKVVEGVYTGFSQGGSYVKRWKDEATGLQRYTAQPFEVSLVDLPCLPTATFSVIKQDGAVELRKFHAKEVKMPTNNEIAARAAELSKAAGANGWGEFVEQARAELTAEFAKGGKMEDAAKETEVSAEIPAEVEKKADVKAEEVVEEAVEKVVGKAPVIETPVTKDAIPAKVSTPTQSDQGEQVWKSNRDGALFAKKADMIAHNEKFDAEAAAKGATAGADAVLAELAEEIAKRKAPAAPVVEKAKNSDKTLTLHKAFLAKKKSGKTLVSELGLEKGLYTVSRLADLIESLSSITCHVKREEGAEGEDSALPAMLQANVSDMCATLRAMVEEETAELMAGTEESESPEYFEYALTLPKASFEAVRKFFPQASVDALVVKRANAEAAAKAKEEAGKIAASALRLKEAEVEALTKKIDDMGAQMGELLKSVKEIAEMPLPLPLQGAAGPVSKDHSSEDLTEEMLVAKRITNDPEFAATHFFKQSYKKPMQFNIER